MSPLSSVPSQHPEEPEPKDFVIDRRARPLNMHPHPLDQGNGFLAPGPYNQAQLAHEEHIRTLERKAGIR
ncbi:MAG: hypothetical protein WC767_02980 [Candidatus Paceibacterota bacterium]|jgi:hypothetical protein